MLKWIKSGVTTTLVVYSLLASSISLAIWSASLVSQVGYLTASLASSVATSRVNQSRAVAKAKAKARLRRLIAATPVVGIAAIGYFEEQDFQEWLAENPNGTRTQYACEVAQLSAEVVDEVLHDLPEAIRRSSAQVADLLQNVGACSQANDTTDQ